MSTVTIEIKGLENVMAQMEKMPLLVSKAVEQGMMHIALDARTNAIESVQAGGKSGRVYKRRNVVHRASAPGQSPASDTGFLVRSIIAQVSGEMTAQLVVKANYAVHLEYGTQKMAARPFVRPAAEKAAVKGAEIIQSYVNQVLS